jgi:hypothetical protein
MGVCVDGQTVADRVERACQSIEETEIMLENGPYQEQHEIHDESIRHYTTVVTRSKSDCQREGAVQTQEDRIVCSLCGHDGDLARRSGGRS